MTLDDGDLDRVTSWLLNELPALVPAWLTSQRWFGAKSRAIEGVDIEDILWVARRPTASALVMLDVRYSEQPAAPSHERYAIMVGVLDDPHGCVTIGHLPWRPGLLAVEAMTHGPAVAALMRGLLTESPTSGLRGGELVYGDATQQLKRLLGTDSDEPQPIVPVGVEQSNTSLRVGSTHVLKLFRRLEEGENPQLEIGRFLAGTTFRAAPLLEGSVIYHSPAGHACALAVVEGWIDNNGDGWSYVTSRLEQAASSAAESDALAEALFGLGTTTADFHVALASRTDAAAFAPEAVTSSDRGLWRQRVIAQADRAFDLIEHRHAEWPDPAAAIGRSLLGARHAVAQHLRALDAGNAADAFHKIRIHGDFHLGQTLKTRDGFAVIDFEGEPTKSLAERRQKHCALRDVAGMMRSLEYAASTVSTRLSDELAGRISVGRLREAFSEGYRSRALSQGGFLPATVAAFDALVALFELEKALYEVEYEVNNRPGWVHIPLGAVGRLLAGRTS